MKTGQSTQAVLAVREVSQARMAGYTAITITVVLWASFALSIRSMAAASLPATDVALIRYAIPALLLLPFLPSRWASLRRAAPSALSMIAIGAGLPFFMLASWGGATTSATHVGALIAGTAPLSIALLGWLIYRQRISASRWKALALIVAGALGLVMHSNSAAPAGAAMAGAGLLLLASLMWGIYTLGLRKAGLDVIGCAIVLNLPSAAALAALVASGAIASHLGHATWKEVMPFVLVQGLGTGLASSLAYAAAIVRLGAEKSSVIGSLAPALTCILAVPLLNEPLTMTVGGGVLLITLGVIVASRARGQDQS
ncbi:MAG: DMT family transporter [Collimonas sp.]